MFFLCLVHYLVALQRDTAAVEQDNIDSRFRLDKIHTCIYSESTEIRTQVCLKEANTHTRRCSLFSTEFTDDTNSTKARKYKGVPLIANTNA